MAEDMRVNGKKIICMVMVFILGLMVANMKDTMLMIKRTDKGRINGQMEDTT